MNDKVTIWRVLLLLVPCLSVCLYLYTNTLDGMRSSSVHHVVEGDVRAVWKEKGIQIQLTSSSGKPSAFPSNLTTETKGSGITQPITAADLMEAYRTLVKTNQSIPVLTLFTSWSDSPDKYLVHNLTSINWLSLRPFVIPIIFTNETSVAEECSNIGWEVLPIRVTAAGGIPVLKFMYTDAMAAFNSIFYGYANGDILFTNHLIETLISLANQIDPKKPTMIVGQRTNVENVTDAEGSSWTNITRVAKERGTLFAGYAEDYFITSPSYPWADMPEVVIGRRAYDNWLVFNARKSKHFVIDITQSSLAVHQTTSVGNFESHSHENSNYDDNLLKKIFKSIQYDAGFVECVGKQSRYNKSGVISIHSRPVHKECKVKRLFV